MMGWGLQIVSPDADMTSLLDCGFELDFLESIDMSDFDCDNYKTREESGGDRGLDIEMPSRYMTSRRTKQK